MGSEDAERWARSDRFSRSSLYISSITHLTIHRPADSPIYTHTRLPARLSPSTSLVFIRLRIPPVIIHPDLSTPSFLWSLKLSVCPHVHHHHHPSLLCWRVGWGWGGLWGETVSGDQQNSTASKEIELTRGLLLLLYTQQNTAHAHTPDNIGELACGGFSS